MNPSISNKDSRDALGVLANGILPPDERDDGAASVQAGAKLARLMASGPTAGVYQAGLAAAQELARDRFGVPVDQLTAEQVDALLGALRERDPAFFKRLRMDVSAMYLRDPDVWRRIGFPGPSIETGGYPDFDQPQ